MIDWNPKYLFNKIFKEEAETEHFLNTICTADWNEEQDAGRTLHEATETLVNEHPEHEENIRAYYTRWPEMLAGSIEATSSIIHHPTSI